MVELKGEMGLITNYSWECYFFKLAKTLNIYLKYTWRPKDSPKKLLETVYKHSEVVGYKFKMQKKFVVLLNENKKVEEKGTKKTTPLAITSK